MSRKSLVVVALLVAIGAGFGGIVHRVSSARGVSEIVIEAPGWRIRVPERPERRDFARLFFSPRSAIATPTEQLPAASAEYIEIDAWIGALLPDASEVEVGAQSALMSMQQESQAAMAMARWRDSDGRTHHGIVVATAFLDADRSRRGLVIELERGESESTAQDHPTWEEAAREAAAAPSVAPGLLDVRIEGDFVKGIRRVLTGAAGRFRVAVSPAKPAAEPTTH